MNGLTHTSTVGGDVCHLKVGCDPANQIPTKKKKTGEVLWCLR